MLASFAYLGSICISVSLLLEEDVFSSEATLTCILDRVLSFLGPLNLATGQLTLGP